MKPTVRINWIFWNEGPLLSRLLASPRPWVPSASTLTLPELAQGAGWAALCT